MDKADVLRQLGNAKGLKLVSIRPLGEARAILELLWHDQSVSLHISLVETLEYHEPKERELRLSASGKVQSARSSRTPTQDEPYAHKDALEALLLELGTYRAIADRFGVGENTVSKWGRYHGLEKRPQPPAEQRQRWVRDIAQRVRAGTMPPYREYAKEIGVSKATVTRLVERARKLLEAP